MKIKLCIAAIAVVSSSVLTLAPAYAAGPNMPQMPQMPNPPAPVGAPQMPAMPQMPQMPQQPQRPAMPQAPAFGPQLPRPTMPQAPAASQPSAPASQPKASGGPNTYAKGQCTWYAKEKRSDIPNGLGNANQWYSRAAAKGFSEGTSPRAGAIGTTTAGTYGHVVYVESVSGSKVNISEMNYNGQAGKVHKRTVAASSFKYIY